MDKQITITVNGTSHSVTTDPTRPLAEVLREDLKLTGTKYGCGEGKCGSCTVLVDGLATQSCITPIEEVDGSEIVTIEGIAAGDKLHPLQEAFLGRTCAAMRLLHTRNDHGRSERPARITESHGGRDSLGHGGTYLPVRWVPQNPASD